MAIRISVQGIYLKGMDIIVSIKRNDDGSALVVVTDFAEGKVEKEHYNEDELRKFNSFLAGGKLAGEVLGERSCVKLIKNKEAKL